MHAIARSNAADGAKAFLVGARYLARSCPYFSKKVSLVFHFGSASILVEVRMTNYLIRRFFQMILVVLLSTVAIYMILNIAPGGPLAGMKSIGDRRNRPSEADMARLEAYLGIDKPL